MHEAAVVRGIEVLARILKILQVNQAMGRVKFQMLHFPHKFPESSNNENEEK
jgi:hypothetical protein